MRLTFRQGIARYQTDIYATPTFLQKSNNGGEFVDLVVSPDPTIVVFAHKNATYVIEETKSIPKAWGPFPGQGTRYLYWDINLLDASVTRGFTIFPQIVSGAPPANPAIDQHWFDTINHKMQVWNGAKWLDKVRVFAATYSSQSILLPFPLGTQAGENGTYEGGNLVLDSYNKPLRQSDGTFVTSATELAIINASSKKVKFESEIVAGMATENIPKFSFVEMHGGKKFRLARSTEWRTRIVGLTTEDLYTSEVGNIETNGLVRNEQWNWPLNTVGRPVFCGATGQVVLEPPQTGVLQVAGYVFDRDTIFIDIKHPTILSRITEADRDQPVGPSGTAPTANFSFTPVSGTAPLVVKFNSTSTGGATGWEWDFTNDGTVDSRQENPTHTFTAVGKYTVKLRATNEFGEHTVIKTDVIEVSTAPPVPGSRTNLSIVLSGPAQVNRGEDFTVTVKISNSGFLPAARVARTIYIEDMDAETTMITMKPPGSTITRDANRTILTMPTIPVFSSGEETSVAFAVRAPNKIGLMKILGGVISPDVDTELRDNLDTLSVRIK